MEPINCRKWQKCIFEQRIRSSESKVQPGDYGILVYSRLAESESRKSVACACLRRIDAGHAVDTGLRSAANTALAFRFSGAMQSIFSTEQSIGMVSVKAYCGTA